jgi:LacI family transcriptional regulator
VIGFDDIPLAEIVEPSLTTVAQPTDKLGAVAIELLMAQIGEAETVPQSVVIPVELRERHSTRQRALVSSGLLVKSRP